MRVSPGVQTCFRPPDIASGPDDDGGESGHALEVVISSNKHEIVFERRSGDDGIDITNKPRSVWWAELTLDRRISVHDRVGQKEGLHS